MPRERRDTDATMTTFAPTFDTALLADRPDAADARMEQAWAVEAPLYRHSVRQYHRMIDAGLLGTGTGVELIEGLLVRSGGVPAGAAATLVDGVPIAIHCWTPEEVSRLSRLEIPEQGETVEFLSGLLVWKMVRRPPHDTALGLLQDRLTASLPPGWMLRVQSAVTLTDGEPEPDLAIVRGERRDYAGRHPGPSECALVIEIADASLPLDRGLKLRTYARHAIPVYWIVNLNDERIEVHTQPSGPGPAPQYRQRQLFVGDDELAVVIGSEVRALFAAKEVLP